MADNTQNQKPGSKDGLALIVGGLFVLGLVFATYTYFNKGNTNTNTSGVDKLKDIISNSTKREEELENEGKGDASNKTEETDKDMTSGDISTGKTGTETEISGGTGGMYSPTTTYSIWIANNYKKGDISGSAYTIKSGDTLWEIAEAVYGDGTQWTRILQANPGKVGFLPNGQQALIYPGQTLVLP